MSAFDAVGSSIDVAPNSLDFSLPTRTSFIQQRNSVTYTPVSGATYGASNTIIQFKISSEGYLDPATAMLNFTLRVPNAGVVPDDLYPVFCWNSLRCVSGGTQAEYLTSAGAALYNQIIHSCDKSWIQSTGSVSCGAWAHCPSQGLSLETTSVGGSAVASTIAPQTSDAASFIGGLSAADNSLGQNPVSASQYVGSTWRPNSMSRFEVNSLTGNARNKLASRKIGGRQFSGRSYSVPLSYLFGIMRTGGKLLPLRNMGALEFTLELNSYAKTFIQCQAATLGENNVITQAAADIAPYGDFTVSAVSITCDICQISSNVVNEIDSLCAGSEGLSLVCDTYVSTLFSSRPPSTTESFSASRPFSNLLATYLSGRPTAGVNSPFWRHTDTYFGSRFVSLQTSVGSAQFPLASIQSTAQAWMELRKSLTRNAIALERGAGVATYESFNSIYPTCWGGLSAASRGTAPDITKITGGNNTSRAAYAASTENLAASTFYLGQSFSRVLGDTETISLSGLSSKTSGYQQTTTLGLIPVSASPNDSDPLAGAPGTLDAAIGSAPIDWLLVQNCSILIKLAMNSTMVSD